MKPITKKPLKPASARKAPAKALPPRLPAQKAPKAPKPTPAPVAPPEVPEAAQAAAPAPRATLRTLAQAAAAEYAQEVHIGNTEGNSTSFVAAMEALVAFLAASTKPARGPATPTDAQAQLIALCQRPEGATAKELSSAVGWPSIAARTTMAKIGARFGYTLTEKPKAEGRGITFYLAAKEG